MKKLLKIASCASEVAPYSKTGGLGDVAKALPKALANLGHKVIIITPFHGFIKKQNLGLEINNHVFIEKIGNDEYKWGFKKLNFSDNLQIYFICNHELFGCHSRIYGYEEDNLRFYFFNLACLKLLDFLNFQPDIIHCHDWQTGLIPNFLDKKRDEFPNLKKAASVFTIHNLTFQFGGDWWKIAKDHADDGKSCLPDNYDKIRYINFSKRGILCADAITTVSERYAQEILTPEFGQGLEKYLDRRKKHLFGIINGIDYAVQNPSFDDNVYYKYDWNTLRRKKKNKLALQKEVGLEQKADIPLIGIVNRLSEQKGFNLIMETTDILMRENLQIVIVGSGDKDYIKFFQKIEKKHPKKIGIYTPFTEEMASKVYAGSDIFLMPSRFEPCGLSQLISLRYGSIPIVRETGGLSETIINFNPKTRKGNGFVFKNYSKEEFLVALTRALENYKYPQTWEFLTWRGMMESYSWELPAKKYIKVFNIAIKKATN